MRNYSGFYQGVSGSYKVFMNYIAGLKFMKKIIFLQFLSDCNVKTRSVKTKVLKLIIIPITHSIIYHNQKAKKSFFATQKSLRVPKLLRDSDKVLLRVLSDSVLFRFLSGTDFFKCLSDSVLFRFLSKWVLFDSSEIDSGSSMTGSSFGLSVFLFWYVTILLSKCATTFSY